MPSIQETSAAYRRRLLAGNREALADIARAYSTAKRRIDERIKALLKKIQAARGAGETVGASWLHESNRLRILREQIEVELGRFSRFASAKTKQQQVAALDLVLEQAAKISTSFVNLPREAFIDLIGNLQDGSPLKELFDGFGKTASSAIQRELIAGLAQGSSMQKIARRIRPYLGESLTRSLTIARTETMRVYRSSSIRSYQNNPDVVTGWVWFASRSSACAMCVSMHGTFHETSEPFASHPNCRCTPIPQTVGSKRVYQFGDDWFAGQPIDVKRAILGSDAALLAYQSKQVKLADFVGESRSSKWGPGRYQRSLKEILGADKAKSFYQRRAA